VHTELRVYQVSEKLHNLTYEVSNVIGQILRARVNNLIDQILSYLLDQISIKATTVSLVSADANVIPSAMASGTLGSNRWLVYARYGRSSDSS
jgi:hypothetical protein